jgi:hypothetical protein
VKSYSSGWISSSEAAAAILKSAISQGYYLNRYDANIASSKMKAEMLDEYCLNTSTSLKKIAERISRKYKMNVSEKTIRAYSKKELGKNGEFFGRKNNCAKSMYLNAIK